jgi:23S rRNA (uridine2552-2'-O)-methyltransferase
VSKDKKPIISGGKKSDSVKVKSKKKRAKSSRTWLERQLNDPYVQQARREGYRGRAVYKIKEMDQHFNLIKRGNNIIDLGCAPGSWIQHIVEKTGGDAKIIGVDLLEIEPIKQCKFIQGDFTEDECLKKINEAVGGKKIDVVLSDMAPNTTGHSKTDHIRIMGMLEIALDFAIKNLADNGDFVAKVFQGGAERDLLDNAKIFFTKVKHFKPQASRKESSEMYLVAKGFKSDKAKKYIEESLLYED